jgi:hypothetical protein
MKRNDPDTTTGAQGSNSLRQRVDQSLQLTIHGHAEGLKNSRRRMDISRPGSPRNGPGN